MQKFFVKDNQIIEDIIEIIGTDVKHITNVLRLNVDEEILEGDFPNKQLKLLLAWITIHEDELKANWELLSNGEGYFKIEPLH